MEQGLYRHSFYTQQLFSSPHMRFRKHAQTSGYEARAWSSKAREFDPREGNAPLFALVWLAKLQFAGRISNDHNLSYSIVMLLGITYGPSIFCLAFHSLRVNLRVQKAATTGRQTNGMFVRANRLGAAETLACLVASTLPTASNPINSCTPTLFSTLICSSSISHQGPSSLSSS